MARVPVFYSFHFDNDVMRVQQIRQMGMIDGDEPVSKNDWETVKRSGPGAIERWIDANMNYKRCVVVLIGTDTHARPWVQYEVKKAWSDNRGCSASTSTTCAARTAASAPRASTRSTSSTSVTPAAAG
jgi:hypothetical protein